MSHSLHTKHLGCKTSRRNYAHKTENTQIPIDKHAESFLASLISFLAAGFVYQIYKFNICFGRFPAQLPGSPVFIPDWISGQFTPSQSEREFRSDSLIFTATHYEWHFETAYITRNYRKRTSVILQIWVFSLNSVKILYSKKSIGTCNL